MDLTELYWAAALPFIVGAAAGLWHLYGPKKRRSRVVLVVPSADETRRSIARFQAAVRRDELIDFVWHKLGPRFGRRSDDGLV